MADRYFGEILDAPIGTSWARRKEASDAGMQYLEYHRELWGH